MSVFRADFLITYALFLSLTKLSNVSIARGSISLKVNVLYFLSNKKILKVCSLNDYIFDLNEPLINFTYIQECKKLGIDRVLMVCDKDNIGSAKSILNNGGILENVIMRFCDIMSSIPTILRWAATVPPFTPAATSSRATR